MLCSWQDADKRICGVNFCQKKKCWRKRLKLYNFICLIKGEALSRCDYQSNYK